MAEIELSGYASKETAYHSFNDEAELFEPPSPPKTITTVDTRQSTTSSVSSHQDKDKAPNPRSSGARSERSPPHTSTKMQRQDSGYGSQTTSPRTSLSTSRPVIARRISISNNSSTNLPIHRPISRPMARFGCRSSAKPFSSTTSAATPVYLGRSSTSYASTTSIHSPPQTSHGKPAYSTVLTQFPSPEPSEPNLTPFQSPPNQNDATHAAPTPTPTPPPQTTHYWTSDRTRRLEYAAIDAASRGLKGWIKRHLIPSCIAPKEDRHLSFDDDSGSVRRYRLDLEEDEEAYGDGRGCAGREKAIVPFRRLGAKKRAWTFWS